MGRPIEFAGIWVHAQTTPCANHCRYCELDHKKVSNITFDRFNLLSTASGSGGRSVASGFQSRTMAGPVAQL